jgi:hypothetical protein
MLSKRKFYRTLIQVEILSEDPFNEWPHDLPAIDYAITNGPCSGNVTELVTDEECDGPSMVKLLKAQGSDPEFFGLTDEGEDIEDIEDIEDNEQLTGKNLSGCLVHIDIDNEEWGRVVSDGIIIETGEESCLVEVESIRANIIVPNNDIVLL